MNLGGTAGDRFLVLKFGIRFFYFGDAFFVYTTKLYLER
jgi:hypothetical protein